VNKNSLIVLVFILALCIVLGAWYLQAGRQSPEKSLQEITIDPGHTAASTLLLVARDQGYFAQNGLNVTFAETPSVAVSMQELQNHTIDFGFINDYSLSDPRLYNKNILAIGTLAESDTNYVVGRRDRGITRVQDLQGKKIGVTKGSIGEYFMDRFFVMNGLSINNVTVVNLPPADLVGALVRGNIDASFSPEPYVYQMRQQLGGNATVWPTNLGQHSQYSLVCTAATLQERPGPAEALLKSVLQAETYVGSHQDVAERIAQNQTKFDEQYMDQDWQNHHFSVSLSQSLITSMDAETRWRIEENLTPVSTVPDFSKSVYPDILLKLRPTSVTLR